MKNLIIKMPKEAIVKLFSVLIFTSGCATINSNKALQERELTYELIEVMGYGKGILSRRTLSFEDLHRKSHQWLFNIDEINQRNYHRDWITENKPFVDFDTIFSEEQQLVLNEKFKSLEKKIIKAKHLNSPEVLTDDGSVVITFPIIQEGKAGEYFGFIAEYTSPESTLFIFKRTYSGWKEVAKVALGIS